MTSTPTPAAQVQLMDQMYSLQRYFYDFTRKYYLFGRDRLIDQMPVADSDRIVEVGCGTGRNLVLLAKKHPKAQFFGFDAANVMIDTAQKKVAVTISATASTFARDWPKISTLKTGSTYLHSTKSFFPTRCR